MRYMVIVKGTKEAEAGVPPTTQDFLTMGKYNEELVKAGVLLAADGLLPSSFGARVRLDGDRRTVTDGPFAETKELVSGFWILQVKSKEEAIEWAKRVPNIFPNGQMELEVRRVAEPEDFGDSFTPEAQAQLDRIHEGVKK